MSGRIMFLAGDYRSAINQFNDVDVQIVGQDLETEKEMIDKGRNFYGQGFRGSHDGNIYVFSNNGCFYNGLRIAIALGDVEHKDVEFYFFERTEPGYKRAYLSKNGRILSAPVGFFDGWESSVMDLLDIVPR